MRVFLSVLLFAIISTNSLFSQSKQDYNWFFSIDRNSQQEGIQGLRFDFNDAYLMPKTADQGLSFDHNNASISDRDGNLLFYTNGCAVADREHHIMPNGDSINAGEFFDRFWGGDCKNGYPGRQDITILPDPAYEDGYYILHKTQEYDPTAENRFFMQYLKYTYVDLALNGGLGDVTEKNVPFAESVYQASYFTSIAHSNGIDWWIIQPKLTENIFYTYLLSQDGFALIDSTILGDNDFALNTSAGGDAKFSPDGTKYAFYNMTNGLWVYDFDRTTGDFSNFKSLYIEEPTSPTFASAEFSPNSRFVYLSNTDSLFQVDLWEDDLEDGKILIDTYDGVQDPFSTSFFLSTLAPDCKIYIRPGSASNIMHVINKPNEKGLDCNFVERGLRLPQASSTGGYPNFPRWRVDEAEVCDPTLTSVFGDQVYYRRDMTVYPNPVRDVVTVDIPEGKRGRIVVFDMMGQLVWEGTEDEYRGDVLIDLSGLSVGSYSVEFLPKDNKDRLVYTSQVIKVE